MSPGSTCLVLLSLTSVFSGFACGAGGGSLVSHPDASDTSPDHADDASPDSGVGEKVASFQKPDCQTARTVCDDNANVLSCVGGHPGDVLDSCAFACSLGRCTTAACADAERNEGVRGCRFYGVQMDNVDEDDGQKLMLLLSNNAPMTVSARVEVPNTDGVWTSVAAVVIDPDNGTRVELNRPVVDVGLTVTGGFRVESDAPIMVVQIVSDDANRTSTSSGGTVLRPVQALGRDYLAVTSPAHVTDAVAEVAGSRNGAGTITVIATEAGTHVSLGLTSPATVGPGLVLDPPPPSYEVPPMNEGDVLQIFTTTPDGDLTGTKVSADFPIAVFSGNIYTTYGFTPSGFNGGDLAEEQLPPTASWGVEYVGVHLSPQANCDPFFGPGVGLWRVVAATPTGVMIAPAPGVTVDGAGTNLPSNLKFHLEPGEFQTFWTRSKLDPPIPTDFVITATEGSILLAQWLDCEPGLSWGIDGRRLTSGDLSFNLPPGFDHEVIVVREAGDPVTFDQTTLESRFHTIVPGLPYEVARLGSGDLGPCQDALDNCQHHLVGANFGVTWRGMDVVCSYALTVPSGQTCALPNVMCPQ